MFEFNKQTLSNVREQKRKKLSFEEELLKPIDYGSMKVVSKKEVGKFNREFQVLKENQN